MNRLQVAAACRQHGPALLHLPPGLDGAQVLWALAGNESSFGVDCALRHEPAFDQGGVYGNGPVMRPLLARWGSAAACSYGPWQLMLCNAPANYAPSDMADLDKAAAATLSFLNRLLVQWHPATLAEVGECWNAGHPLSTLSAGVARYVHDLTVNYAVPLP
jgi:hypothetical protein